MAITIQLEAKQQITAVHEVCRLSSNSAAELPLLQIAKTVVANVVASQKYDEASLACCASLKTHLAPEAKEAFPKLLLAQCRKGLATLSTLQQQPDTFVGSMAALDDRMRRLNFVSFVEGVRVFDIVTATDVMLNLVVPCLGPTDPKIEVRFVVFSSILLMLLHCSCYVSCSASLGQSCTRSTNTASTWFFNGWAR